MYRPDIDGLRAVAVLAVILFHINPHWLPGGFVGVDVFFVISGYLITGIVAKELQEGRFTIKAFYERRIRRILPALWALLLVCLPISFWLMLPADAEAMAKSAMWSILAMANVYFWREVTTDYFAPQSAQMPFLHLWSLGVEEQFYVLWPLVALFVLPSVGRARLGDVAVRSESVGWAIRTIQISAVSIYFLSAWAKMRFGTWGWANGATLIWALTRRPNGIGPWIGSHPALVHALQWLILCAEFLSPALLWLRGRALAVWDPEARGFTPTGSAWSPDGDRIVLTHDGEQTVRGRGFHDGCGDSESCTLGCGCEVDDPESPSEDVELRLTQLGRSWTLGMVDADDQDRTTWTLSLIHISEPTRPY